MIKVGDKLVDNNLTREELLERVVIKKTTNRDFDAMCRTIMIGFDLSHLYDAEEQLTNSQAYMNESVKLVDKYTGDIYGLLTLSDFPITVGSPIMSYEPEIGKYLSRYNQVNGHSFILDKRLRGLGFDLKMLNFNLKFVTDNFDFVWCGVEATLKSNNYWERMGFIELFNIPVATFYIRPLSKKFLNDIYKKCGNVYGKKIDYNGRRVGDD